MFQDRIQQGLVAISGLINTTLFVIIVRKLHCRKNKGNEYSLNCLTKTTIHVYYLVTVLWHFCYFGSIFILPISRYFESSIHPIWLCKIRYSLSFCAVSHLLALSHLLTNRINDAFKDSAVEISQTVHLSIRITVTLGCFLLYFVLGYNIYSGDNYRTQDHDDCGVDSIMVTQRVYILGTLAFQLLSLMSTVTLFIMFMTKLSKLRDIFIANQSALNNDDDFLYELIKKQSILMLWIVTTTVVAALFVYKQIDEYVSRLPLIFDFTANAIAIFLSFSFNQSWYDLCGCNQCANVFIFCYLNICLCGMCSHCSCKTINHQTTISNSDENGIGNGNGNGNGEGNDVQIVELRIHNEPKPKLNSNQNQNEPIHESNIQSAIAISGHCSAGRDTNTPSKLGVKAKLHKFRKQLEPVIPSSQIQMAQSYSSESAVADCKGISKGMSSKECLKNGHLRNYSKGLAEMKYNSRISRSKLFNQQQLQLSSDISGRSADTEQHCNVNDIGIANSENLGIDEEASLDIGVSKEDLQKLQEMCTPSNEKEIDIDDNKDIIKMEEKTCVDQEQRPSNSTMITLQMAEMNHSRCSSTRSSWMSTAL